jgi:AcrR family transcriptional regulator
MCNLFPGAGAPLIFSNNHTVTEQEVRYTASGFETPRSAGRFCALPNSAGAFVRKRTTGGTVDRRQRRSRKAIYDAFEALMSTEHYSQVTVAQIIERADVGRSTFYAHFETKDDLLRSMCAEMFDHIFEGVNAYCVTHQELQTADLQGKLAHLLYHLRDTHSGVCGKLVAEGEPIFTECFQDRLRSLIDAEVGEKPLVDAPSDLVSSMLVSAFCQAVAWWLARGAREKPEQLAAWFVALVG